MVRQVDIRLVPQGVLLPQRVLAGGAVHDVADQPGRGAGRDLRRQRVDRRRACRIPADPNDATKCTPQSGAITSYQWDFGNGQTGSGARVTTRFADPRHLQRHAWWSRTTAALSNTVTQTVTVAAVTSPTAIFTLSPDAPGVNQQVFVDANASKAAPGRTITRYDWNFGDGGFGSGVTESHRYSQRRYLHDHA